MDADQRSCGPRQMLYTDMERRFEEDGEARAAARSAAEEDLLLNHAPDVRELPTVLEADLDASHDAGVLSVQICPGAKAVITGSGRPARPLCRSPHSCACSVRPEGCEHTLSNTDANAGAQGTLRFSGLIFRAISCGAHCYGAVESSAWPSNLPAGFAHTCPGAVPLRLPKAHALLQAAHVDATFD